MHKAENRNAPNLWGWVIGAAAGLVAFGVLVIVGKFDLFPAGAMAAAVAGAVGLILGMPWGAGSMGPMPVANPEKPAEPKPVAAVAEAVAQPVAFISTPAPAPAPKPKAAPKAKAEAPAAKPAAKAAPKPKAAKPAGPERLKAPRKGQADDLKEIEGIGPAMEKLVNSLGFYHFEQIASWSDADVELVDAEMKTFKGRITRDKWVAQAKIIVTEGLEAFRERAKTNNY
jgi:predicted flap endonuclease-1-like 5' DNA nuclease